MNQKCGLCNQENPSERHQCFPVSTQMTNQYALGFKAGLDAAVDACRNDGWNAFADLIAALPAPSSSSEDCGEVQWRDLTDDELWELFTSQDWTGQPLGLMVEVIAKFKEVNT